MIKKDGRNWTNGKGKLNKDPQITGKQPKKTYPKYNFPQNAKQPRK